MQVISVKDLWVRFPGEPEPALRGLSLEVGEGELVVLMGPSGGGKTTLCYCLLGIIPHLIRAEVRGHISVLGLDPRRETPSRMARQVGLVFQNPELQLVTDSVYQEVAFPLENAGLPPDEISKRIEEVLEFTRLKPLKDVHPRELSGGQKQVLAIASVLALRPKLLLLDEPTSQLDHAGVVRVLELLLRLRREYSLTILAVEHRIEWVAEHADRILVLADGALAAQGPPRELFSKRELVRALGVRCPQVAEVAYELSDVGIRLSRVPVNVSEALSELSALLRP
ncbi:MAG: energy-coupling factor ABC transporter ATP-binding protein [Nitrososphaerota archaeon]